VVVANILANPLVLLSPLLAARVRPQGRSSFGRARSSGGTCHRYLCAVV
jgi:ribosomal protein L11 methylase PrmA